MNIESAANAACVRGEIVCISPHFYQSPPLVLNISLTRAQAALSAPGLGGQFVCPAGPQRVNGSSFAITHGRVSKVWR